MNDDAARVLEALDAIRDPRYVDVLELAGTHVRARELLAELEHAGAVKWLSSGALLLTSRAHGRRRHFEL